MLLQPPAPVGMRSRASGAVCLDASFCCFWERASLRSRGAFLGRAKPDRAGARPIAIRRMAQERVPTSRNGIG